MKRLLVAMLTGLGALAAFRRVQRTRDEQALWSEATDPVTRPGA